MEILRIPGGFAVNLEANRRDAKITKSRATSEGPKNRFHTLGIGPPSD
jgi:hypothetical protein